MNCEQIHKFNKFWKEQAPSVAFWLAICFLLLGVLE